MHISVNVYLRSCVPGAVYTPEERYARSCLGWGKVFGSDRKITVIIEVGLFSVQLVIDGRNTRDGRDVREFNGQEEGREFVGRLLAGKLGPWPCPASGCSASSLL